MADLFFDQKPPNTPPSGASSPEHGTLSVSQDAPLAERMRPRCLADYAGQEHILGPGKLLRRAIEADRLTSILLYGPPGTGKTTLARIIAESTRSHFEPLSGVENSVADLRRALAAASERARACGKRTLLFVDEIHRLNKAQQDVLLPEVEKGGVRLIGATTHNPFFVLTSALVSRSQVFQLEPLSVSGLIHLQQRALADETRGLGRLNVRADAEALELLAVQAEGDARKVLNALELAVLTTPPGASGEIHLTTHEAQESIQRKAIVYDRDGDQHYDTISALIKSIRGCDPDAALYWLARMLAGGEDIRFLARRLVILASEDVGMADPQALPLAVAAQQAVEFVGLPEAQIPLAHAAVYLATAPKSNRAYAGILAARKDVEKGVTLAVPKHLRDTHYPGAQQLGHQGYLYSHDYEGGYVPQAYLPEGRRYYTPSENGAERRVKERLEYWRALFDAEKKPTG
jgi:putative ATPase